VRLEGSVLVTSVELDVRDRVLQLYFAESYPPTGGCGGYAQTLTLAEAEELRVQLDRAIVALRKMIARH